MRTIYWFFSLHHYLPFSESCFTHKEKAAASSMPLFIQLRYRM
ncbi:hypothetical protein B4144_2982 [Bacillus atrophaeus]|nr:hypothetical protein B4144_2982 [Bacillus atrophaeus]